MAFNPNEAPEGYAAVESEWGNGCYVCDCKPLSKECVSTACEGSYRKDGCCVIFVKKPARDSSPAQITWPRDSEGREVQA